MALGALHVTLQLRSLYGAQHVAEHSFAWPAGQQSHFSSKFCAWGVLWADDSAALRDDGFQVVVDVASRAPRRPVVSDPAVLRGIALLVLGAAAVPLKFLLFSRPRVDPATGAVGAEGPLPVYATAWQLANQCDYFNAVLGADSFAEAKLVSWDAPPAEPWVARYDYDSDSDLGYFSDDDEGGPHGVDGPACPEGDSNMDHEAGGDSSMILDPLAGPENTPRIGRVVAVKDVAYVTWRAMIFYLCTSQVAFAPLTCHGLSRRRTAAQRTLGLPPRPSAKSMYRLADKLGLDDLAALALEHIRAQLSTDTVFRELCSRFTAQYQAVRDVELAFTFQHWDEMKGSQTFREVVSDIADGAFPHAKDVLLSLLTHST